MTNPFKRTEGPPEGTMDVSGLFDCQYCGESQEMAIYDSKKQQIRWECINDHLNEVAYVV